MLKYRVIPIVLIDGFSVLKTIKFNARRNLGSPITVMRTYETRNIDELIILDIDAAKQNRSVDKWLIKDISKECFMPLTIGGGITNCNQIEALLRVGADKVSINSSCYSSRKFVRDAVKNFGSQCIVCSIDIQSYQGSSGIYQNEHVKLANHIEEMEQCEVGEFLFCDVEREGTLTAPNFNLASTIRNLTKKTMIFVGGISHPDQCAELVINSSVNAVGASSLFHFTGYTPQDCRNSLRSYQLPARLDL